jgi:hypothetical protein
VRIISPIQARYEQAVGVEATRLFAPGPASAGTVARHAPELVAGISGHSLRHMTVRDI